MTSPSRFRRLPGAVTAGSLLERFVPRGAILLSVLAFGSLAMAQLRNRVFANTYGAGPELDAFYAAFRIPEIALDILVAAGLTAPFVPIYNTLRRSDERAATDFGRTVLTVAVLIMAITASILFLLAPWIGEQFGRDFDPATRATYVQMFRINCLAQILFAASITLGEVLVANQRFLFYALAPILYTGGIVAGTVVFAHRFGIYASAWGAVAGAVAHLAIRAVGTLRTTFRFRPQLHVRTAPFREFVRLMLPRMLSYPIEPLVLTYFTLLALSIGVGSVSILNFALDYQVVPVSLIGISFSLAAFPILSAAYARGDRGAFRTVLVRNLLVIGGLTTLAAIILFVGARLLVRILLGGGNFGADEIERTAIVLGAFALSVPFDSLQYPLSRALYATHNTVLQVAGSFAGFGVTIASAWALAPSLGIVAIPLGYAVGLIVKVTLLAFFVTIRLRRMPPDTAVGTAPAISP